MKPLTYDVVVVGATRAGAAVVELAHQQGLSVALVDYASDPRNDDALWSELLLQANALRDALFDRNGSPRVYHEAARQAWRGVASRWRDGSGGIALESSPPASGLAVFHGPARFLSSSRIELHCGTQIEAGTFVIATGSTPSPPYAIPLRGNVGP